MIMMVIMTMMIMMTTVIKIIMISVLMMIFVGIKQLCAISNSCVHALPSNYRCKHARVYPCTQADCGLTCPR